MRTLITCCLLLSLCGCAKFDHKISTKVEGTVRYADGSPASGVYVKLVQVFKTSEGTSSSAGNINLVLIVETNSEGSFDFKFKDDPRPEGSTGHLIGMLSETTEVEFLRTNENEIGNKKNKIKTGRKNRIDAIIKN
jgi:hypothetical protein